MNDGFTWWLVVLGIAVGIGVVWLFTIRLPRDETDVDQDELHDEAGWISGTIESAGGIAPQSLVQEVLELHRQYLAGEHGLAERSDDEAIDAEPDASDVVPPSLVAGPDASDAQPTVPGAEPDVYGIQPPMPVVDAPPILSANPPQAAPADRQAPTDQTVSGVE